MCVVRPAVELGDQAPGRPERVDLITEDVGVRNRSRELSVMAEGQECALERRPSFFGVRSIGQDRADRLQGVPAPAPLDHLLQLFHLEQAKSVGLLACCFQTILGNAFAQVEQSPGGAGGRNSVANRDFVVLDLAFVERDADASGPSMPGGDIDVRWTGAEQPQVSRRRTVAQNRTVTAGENGGHPSSSPVKGRPPNRVGTAMNREQAPGFCSSFDRPRLEPEVDEVRVAHDPVLTVSQQRELSLSPACLSLRRHIGPNLRNVDGSPRGGGWFRGRRQALVRC